MCGLIGKKYITSVTQTKESNTLWNDNDVIDRNYFCKKHVVVEIASEEGLIKGFFDFRDDDYRDVIIQSFEDSKLQLKYGKEVDVDAAVIERTFLKDIVYSECYGPEYHGLEQLLQ